MATNETPSDGTAHTPDQEDDHERTALGTRADRLVKSVLTSEPLVTLRSTVKTLDERVAALERLEARLQNVETTAAVVTDLRRALRSVIVNLYALERRLDETEDKQATAVDRLETLEEQLTTTDDQIADLDARIADLESMFGDGLTDKQQAHIDAQKRDVESVVSVGETRTVVPTNRVGPETVIARIERLVTFVDTSDANVTVGEPLVVRITDTQDTCAHATPVERSGQPTDHTGRKDR